MNTSWKRTNYIIIGSICLHAALLWYNFQRVPLTYGYDWPGHFSYLFYIAEHWRAPDVTITPSYFNPPIYYYLVAAFSRVFAVPLVQAGLLFNQLLALLTIIGLTMIVRQWLGQRWQLVLLFMALYVSNPTLYRTLGMMRPEPLLLLVYVVALGYVWVQSNREDVQWERVAITLALIGAFAIGVRQWGGFLQIGLFCWLGFAYWQRSGAERSWKRLILLLLLEGGLFTILFLLIYTSLRGGQVLAFSAEQHAIDSEFVLRLELETLFSMPIRPNLNYRFWPLLYADYWGDYWRYWRESYGHSGAPNSPQREMALRWAMWGGLPATLLLFGGLWQARPKLTKARNVASLFVWSTFVVAIIGYLLFAAWFAEFGKGDTVKSVYLLYLIPLGAWLITDFVSRWRRPLIPVLIVVIGLLPTMSSAFYLPAPNMFSRTWEQPVVAQPLDVQIGDAYMLTGYELNSAENDLVVTLVWRADAYTGKHYKVFVHALGQDGTPVAQSDAIPAEWLRPTESWMLGEYVTDVHRLQISAEQQAAIVAYHVGMYNRFSGERLIWEDGADHIVLQP